MLPYFKNYSIAVCVIAVAFPLIASTIYPLFTGHIMASSFYGFITLFVLFFLGLFIGFGIFETLAERKTESYLNAYNIDCDPEALVKEGAKLASDIPMPCNKNGSWFLGYYAQALLDTGNVEGAKKLREELTKSMDAMKSPAAKLGILVNILPLEEKIASEEDALKMVQEGFDLLEKVPSGRLVPIRDFLSSQKKIFQVRSSDDQSARAQLDDSILANQNYPMRIRVEAAWDAASAYRRLDDMSAEKDRLDFVVKHGNKLLLAQRARQVLHDVS